MWLTIELSLRMLSLWVHTKAGVLLNWLAICLLLGSHWMSKLLLGILSLELVVLESWLLRLLHHWLTEARLRHRVLSWRNTSLLLRILWNIWPIWIILHVDVSASSLLNFLGLDDHIEALVKLMDLRRIREVEALGCTNFGNLLSIDDLNQLILKIGIQETIFLDFVGVNLERINGAS